MVDLTIHDKLSEELLAILQSDVQWPLYAERIRSTHLVMAWSLASKEYAPLA
jgi:hypothetical protein